MPGTAIEAQQLSLNSDRPPYDFSAWLIDLDGTLYRQTPVRLMMAIELMLWGRPQIATLRVFRQEHELLRNLTSHDDRDPFALQIKRTADRLDKPPSDVVDIVDRWMCDRPGRWLRLFARRRFLRVIAKYRSLGGRTAIVSDYPARRKLAALGVTALFDAVVACGEPGGPNGLKPTGNGFFLAANQIGIGPEQCLVIGDRVDADGEAAHRAGMAFCHIASRWPR
jgi:FMN phosphatase YigB (HAD superfamily)